MRAKMLWLVLALDKDGIANHVIFPTKIMANKYAILSKKQSIEYGTNRIIHVLPVPFHKSMSYFKE
jgi:hypothetical protein